MNISLNILKTRYDDLETLLIKKLYNIYCLKS